MGSNDTDIAEDPLIESGETDPGISVLDTESAALPTGFRMVEEDTHKPALLSRRSVAIPAFIIIVVLGALLVSSLEKVPVPPSEAERAEQEELTAFERAAAARLVLDELGIDASIAYQSVEGLSVFDLGEANDVSVDAETELLGSGPFRVLRDGDRRLVLYTDDRNGVSRTIGVESTFDGDVVSTATAGTFVAVGDGDVTGGEVRAQFVYVLEGPSLDPERLSVVRVQQINPDLGFFLAPGLGAMIERDDGGTRVFDARGLRDFSDHRVVAATANARVELRCDERCSPFYVGPAGEKPLPDAVANSDLSISPDGRWIVVFNTQEPTGPTIPSQGVGAQLLEVSTGDLLPVPAGWPGPPAWSVDSSFVAWLDPSTNDASIVVVGVDDRTATTIDIDALGAPNRDGDAVIFLP